MMPFRGIFPLKIPPKKIENHFDFFLEKRQILRLITEIRPFLAKKCIKIAISPFFKDLRQKNREKFYMKISRISSKNHKYYKIKKNC